MWRHAPYRFSHVVFLRARELLQSDFFCFAISLMWWGFLFSRVIPIVLPSRCWAKAFYVGFKHFMTARFRFVVLFLWPEASHLLNTLHRQLVRGSFRQQLRSVRCGSTTITTWYFVLYYPVWEATKTESIFYQLFENQLCESKNVLMPNVQKIHFSSLLYWNDI